MTNNSGCNNNPENPYAGDCEFTQFLLDRAAGRVQAENVGKLDRQELLSKARSVQLLLLDVDGVLTDGSITYTHSGEEIKTFNCRDGFGMNMLKKIGVEVGLITARKSEALNRRVQDLSLTHVYQGVRNKVEAFNEIIEHLKLTPAQCAFMGDDWLDLPLLSRVGLSATVADGAPELKNIVHFIAQDNGGGGAVRNLCDLIIEAKGKRDTLLQEYLLRK